MADDVELRRTIAKVVEESKEPLETKEVEKMVKDMVGEEVSRSKILYRLNDLRGEGEIAGKFVGSGKGVWIWWRGSKRRI